MIQRELGIVRGSERRRRITPGLPVSLRFLELEVLILSFSFFFTLFFYSFKIFFPNRRFVCFQYRNCFQYHSRCVKKKETLLDTDLICFVLSCLESLSLVPLYRKKGKRSTVTV